MKRFLKRLGKAFWEVVVCLFKAIFFGVLISLPVLLLCKGLEYLTGSSVVALGILGLIFFVGLVVFFYIVDISDDNNK